MEIRMKDKLRKMTVEDLASMRLSLCYNQETNDYEIFIRQIDGNGIIIQNATNCREIIVLNCDREKEILFVGEIGNMDLVNMDLSNKYTNE